MPVGEICLGDNGIAGAGGNYIVVVGPKSPTEPFVGCDGVVGSGRFTDACRVCGGNDDCLGCDGVANSGVTMQCGVCGGTCVPLPPGNSSDFVIAFGGGE